MVVPVLSTPDAPNPPLTASKEERPNDDLDDDDDNPLSLNVCVKHVLGI